MRCALVIGLTLGACSDHKDAAKHDPDPQQAPALVRTDGGLTAVLTTATSPDAPVEEDTTSQPNQTPTQNRPGRPIDITLRSTPGGATVAVDGTVIGRTPAFWTGLADGREHEFVFTLRSHAIARYRFVPVSSGVIHGRLEPISEENDAGVPPPELVPHPAPPAPSQPPPTGVTPADAPPQNPAPVGPQP